MPTHFPERLAHNFEYDQIETEKHVDPEPSLFESFIVATTLEQESFLSFGAGVDVIVTIIFLIIFSLAFFINASFFLFVWKEKLETSSVRSASKWISLSQVFADLLSIIVTIHLLIWLLLKENLLPSLPCQLLSLALSLSILISMISHLVMMTIQFAITKTSLKEVLVSKLIQFCKMYILLSWLCSILLAGVLIALENVQHSEKDLCNLNLISRIIFPFVVIYFISLIATFVPMVLIAFSSCRADMKIFPSDENSDDNDSDYGDDQKENNKGKRVLRSVKRKVLGKKSLPTRKMCPVQYAYSYDRTTMPIHPILSRS